MTKFSEMKYLIKKATVIDPHSSFNGKKVDLLIENGKIKAIDLEIEDKEANVVSKNDLVVMPGLIDVAVEVGDPGYEHREDLNSVAEAAVVGGFSAIITQPNTNPVVHTKSEVKYLKNHSGELLIDLYPLGAVSANCEGKELTEMIDMFEAGAVAFTDGKNAIQDNGLMLRALQYVKTFGGTVLNRAHDDKIAAFGQVHEGPTSTLLGMKGIPSMAEDLMVQRDVYLTAYTQSSLHILNVSTKGAVEIIRAAKKKGINLTASVAVLNLYFIDEALQEFDAYLKVLPPFRSEEDRLALIKGLKDGTIDFLTTNHVPVEEEGKKLEFPYANFGATGLETSLALSWKIFKNNNLTLDDLVKKWSSNARNIFNLDQPTIEKGADACLTLFDPNKKWSVSKNDLRSKSHNTPLLNHELEGRVIGVLNKRKSWFR